jgi:hypothetical protein
MERGGSMKDIIITIALIGLVAAVLIWRIKREMEEYEMEKLTKQMKIDKLEREIEELKGFPLVKVHEVQIGEFISISDNVYICLGISPNSYERKFFDLTNRKCVNISSAETVRERKDLETAIYKII